MNWAEPTFEGSVLLSRRQQGKPKYPLCFLQVQMHGQQLLRVRNEKLGGRNSNPKPTSPGTPPDVGEPIVRPRLTQEARDRAQAQNDAYYAMFVERVSGNRGLSEAYVRATEGLSYNAAEGVELGLADSIGELSDALAALRATLQPSRPPSRRRPPQAAAEAETVTAAVAADRARSAKVWGSPERAGREPLATHFLTATDMTAEQIVVALGKSPKPAESGGFRRHFSEALERGLGVRYPDDDGEGLEDWSGKTERAAAILQAYQHAGGELRGDSKRAAPNDRGLHAIHQGHQHGAPA